MAVRLNLAVLLLAVPAFAQTVFSDRSVPQVAFAAAEIARAAPAITNLPFDQFATGSCKLCVVLASGAAQSAALASQLKTQPLASGKPQSYGIRRVSYNGRDVIAVLASDADGALYGGLDVAESVRLGTLQELRSSDHAPHIENRGIKFNVPPRCPYAKLFRQCRCGAEQHSRNVVRRFLARILG